MFPADAYNEAATNAPDVDPAGDACVVQGPVRAVFLRLSAVFLENSVCYRVLRVAGMYARILREACHACDAEFNGSGAWMGWGVGVQGQTTKG